MIRATFARSLLLGALSVAVIFALVAPAHALFPFPFVPNGNINGEPEPDPPTIPPVPTQPPSDPGCTPAPDPCGCNPPNVNNTPEPATILSSLFGAALIGGYAARRRRAK